jgi:hypothetical protein
MNLSQPCALTPPRTSLAGGHVMAPRRGKRLSRSDIHPRGLVTARAHVATNTHAQSRPYNGDAAVL